MTKLALFLSSLFIQLVMYVGIYLRKIKMPRHFDEEIICVNELALLLGKKDVSNININRRLQLNDHENFSETHLNPPFSPSSTSRSNINGLYINEEQAALPISTAFVEYTYIIFWIMKDLFWSISTGDLGIRNLEFAIFSETIALFFGTVAFSVYCISAYIYRRHTLSFLDSITTLFWISANYVWMCGEFFLRYQNLELDDTTQGNDANTRVIATIFFSTGICIQIYVIIYLSITKFRKRKKNRRLYWTPSLDKVSFNFKRKVSKSYKGYSDISYDNTNPQADNNNNTNNNSINNNISNDNNNRDINKWTPSISVHSVTSSYSYNNNNHNNNHNHNINSTNNSNNRSNIESNNNTDIDGNTNLIQNGYLKSTDLNITTTTTCTTVTNNNNRNSRLNLNNNTNSTNNNTSSNNHDNDAYNEDDDGEEDVMVFL